MAGKTSGASAELEERLREELAPELRVLGRLSESPKSSTYLAREPDLKRLVAIKVLAPRLGRNEAARARFEREAQAVASLSHPSLVAIHRVGRLSNGLPYIVMRYVQGRTLADRLRAEGRLAVDEARRILVQVASALAAAHSKGVVHRDVRPCNVLCDEETGRSLLTDFGTAAVMPRGELDPPTRLTKTGELIGDPAYMSPEQLVGSGVSGRSDVYALGVLGYELLTGRGPYDAGSQKELVMAHLRGRPRDLSRLRRDVDRGLAALLERCLAKDPRHRPTAADVARLAGSSSPGLPVTVELGSRDFLARLKERRIVQIAMLNGAIAWGLLEAIGELVEHGILPEVGYRLALVSTITGLPAVLIGAWFHGKAGRQKFRVLEYWLFAALALIWLGASAVVLFSWMS